MGFASNDHTVGMETGLGRSQVNTKKQKPNPTWFNHNSGLDQQRMDIRPTDKHQSYAVGQKIQDELKVLEESP